MKEWFAYLLDKVYEELDILLKLILIDNKIEGNIYSINDLINFLKNTPMDKKFYDSAATSILIEQNPESLIKAISDNLLRENIKIIVLKNNLGLNKWVAKKYLEFVSVNNINENIKIDITNHFKITTGEALIIGCEAFTEERKENSLVPCEIVIEEI